MIKEKVYLYDSNGYYTQEDYAYNQAYPINSTLIAPTTKEGFIPQFVKGEWKLIENHVGERGYVNNEPFEVTEYGAYPQGWHKEYREEILTIHQQALLLQMTKREFLKIVINLTANTEGLTPITLAMIEGYVAQAGDDIRLEWDYATYIERKHPMLDVVASDPMFGISSDLLDILFVNKDKLIYAIDNGLPLG